MLKQNLKQPACFVNAIFWVTEYVFTLLTEILSKMHEFTFWLWSIYIDDKMIFIWFWITYWVFSSGVNEKARKYMAQFDDPR